MKEDPSWERSSGCVELSECEICEAMDTIEGTTEGCTTLPHPVPMERLECCWSSSILLYKHLDEGILFSDALLDVFDVVAQFVAQ